MGLALHTSPNWTRDMSECYMTVRLTQCYMLLGWYWDAGTHCWALWAQLGDLLMIL